MSFQELVSIFGLPGAMLAMAVLLLYYDLVVSGARYRSIVRQRDALLRLVLSAQGKTSHAADLLEGLTEPERKRALHERD